MNKFKFILIILSIAFIFISCSETENDIDFYLKPGIDTVEINSEYSDPGAEAFINGSPVDYEISENNVDTSQTGIYYIEYALPFRNSQYIITRIVTVIDETPPEINLNPGIDTINLNQEWIDESVTVTDNSNGVVLVETIGEVDNTTLGEYEITYIATDEYGNQSELIRIVNVIE